MLGQNLPQFKSLPVIALPLFPFMSVVWSYLLLHNMAPQNMLHKTIIIAIAYETWMWNSEPAAGAGHAAAFSWELDES